MKYISQENNIIPLTVIIADKSVGDSFQLKKSFYPQSGSHILDFYH